MHQLKLLKLIELSLYRLCLIRQHRVLRVVLLEFLVRLV